MLKRTVQKLLENSDNPLVAFSQLVSLRERQRKMASQKRKKGKRNNVRIRKKKKVEKKRKRPPPSKKKKKKVPVRSRGVTQVNGTGKKKRKIIKKSGRHRDYNSETFKSSHSSGTLPSSLRDLFRDSSLKH